MNKPVTIDNFQKGIAISALFGFEKISNMDIESEPGAIKQGFMLDQMSKTKTTYTIESVNTTNETVTATVNYVEADIHLQGVVFSGASLPTGITAGTLYWAVFNDVNTIWLYDTYVNALTPGATGKINISGSGSGTFVNVVPGEIRQFCQVGAVANGEAYALDANGRVWHITTGNSVQLVYSVSSPSSLMIYKGHILVFGNSKVYGSNLSPQSWTEMTITTGSAANVNDPFDTGYSFIGPDDAVYFTNGRYVAKIKEVAGQTFASETAATYTINLYALDLPANETTTCLSRIGDLIVVGTKSENIYPWDGKSPSYNTPFSVGETYVWRMLNRNNQLVIFAGNAGKVFVSNGTASAQIAQVPDKLIGNKTLVSSNTSSVQIVDAILFDDEILFSLEHTGLDKLSEVWSINSSNILTLKNTYSKVQSGAYIVYGGGLLKTYGGCYLCSWNCSDGTSGIDSNWDTNHRVAVSGDTYKPYFISPLFQVGTTYNKKTFLDLEIQLTDKLVNGNNIVLYYRENLNDSWTTIGTITYTTNPDDKSIRLPFAFAGPLEHVQIKCEYYGGGTAEFNPGIKSITFI